MSNSSNIPALGALLLNPSFATSPLLPLLSAISPASLPGCLTSYLFRPTPQLQRTIDALLPPNVNDTTRTVSVQVRLGDDFVGDAELSEAAAERWEWHEESLDRLMGGMRGSGNKPVSSSVRPSPPSLPIPCSSSN